MSKEGASVLYSLSLASIGHSTHAAGSAGAHMRYILRNDAVAGIVGRGIPGTAAEAAAWMDAQELGDRANARVCDGVIVALPHQLTHEQRKALLRGWCDDVSTGVPYVAALHKPSQKGDERNHHAHVVFRDRDPATGKRAMMSTDKGFADRMRTSWERHVNTALGAAGIDGRTDCRSLAARGIDRAPQLHVGPAATATARRAGRDGAATDKRPSAAQPLRSATHTVRNSPGARSRTRDVDYPAIDGGRTRAEENARRITANASRDRADAQAAREALLAQAHTAAAGIGVGAAPTTARTAPAPIRPHAAAPTAGRTAQAGQAPTTARPSRAMALAMERMPPDLTEPTPTPTPHVPERATTAAQETPAGRSARLIAEGEQWLAEARAAGQIAPAAQAATAPAAPGPGTAGQAAPSAPATPGPEAAAPALAAPQAAIPTGRTLMSAARRAGQAAASGVGSVTRLAVTALNTFRRLPAPEPPAAPTPTAAPPIPTPAPRPARDFSGAVQDVTVRHSDGTVRFYTTEEEQQGNGRGLGGLERTLRQAGVPVERRTLFQDTDEGGQARSWLSLTCRRHDLELAVRRMGDAGADLVERLRRATARSARHIQAHIQPWRDRLRAERAAQGVTRPRPTPTRDGPGIT